MIRPKYLSSLVDRSPSKAFTLVEMLVAMAVTLLMMAALARAFGFIGEQVRDSRATLQLSSDLRDITTRLTDELERCTVSLQPNTGGPDQPGYFLYYEGPVTDTTSSTFRAFDVDGQLSLPDSRFGDFDDYLAFTAVAPDNAWFTGKVPRYLLEAKSHEVNGTAYSYTETDHGAFEPVVIRSKYAEIIYFASPEYDDTVPNTEPTYPKYVDIDGDLDLDGDGDAINNGLPDRLRIYRRVLLIRPDLNVDPSALNYAGSDLIVGGTDPPHLPRMPHDHDDDNATQNKVFMQTGLTNWLVAMAAVHQQCDLSVRRVLNPTTGLPTNRVAANSLADLSKPHNRFAHVRIPSGDLGIGGVDDTSMPVLALGRPATVLNMTNENGDRISPTIGPNAPMNDPVVTPENWCGFLRPEFVLGHDRINADPEDPAWSLQSRLGEDLLVTGALAFDLQIFDSSAALVTDAGTGLVIGPNDAGYRGLLNGPDIDMTIPADAVRVSYGSFVDLAYPVLAGGSLRGWEPRTIDRRSLTDNDSVRISDANRIHLLSNFSGLRSATADDANDVYRASLYKSGKLVVNGSTQIRLLQPTFDTFTSSYESDGLVQDNRLTAGNFEGTIWTTVTTGADTGADGLDNGGLPGIDDAAERETLAPFDSAPEAIRVTIRLENDATRHVLQASVVHRDSRE